MSNYHCPMAKITNVQLLFAYNRLIGDYLAEV